MKIQCISPAYHGLSIARTKLFSKRNNFGTRLIINLLNYEFSAECKAQKTETACMKKFGEPLGRVRHLKCWLDTKSQGNYYRKRNVLKFKSFHFQFYRTCPRNECETNFKYFKQLTNNCEKKRTNQRLRENLDASLMNFHIIQVDWAWMRVQCNVSSLGRLFHPTARNSWHFVARMWRDYSNL